MFGFLRGAFSDDGAPSSSRLIMYQHSCVACFILIFLSVKNHAAPDPLVIAALGAFVGVAYGINRFSKGRDTATPAAPGQP
jgi:hypothetical protein